jgi:lipopolysaccharide export system permease protein
MSPSLFRSYLGRDILKATVFVMLAFLAMFMFFDVLAEMDEVGAGGYRFEHAILYVLLGMPSRMVELAPIAALIGTLWALSQSAAHSEFTVFRVSGLQPDTAIRAMLRIGLPMVVVIAVSAEWVVPWVEDFRSKVRDGGLGSSTGEMRSGLWLRDTPNVGLAPGATQGQALRFVNAKTFTTDQTLRGVLVYDFDRQQRLVQTIEAESARFLGQTDERYNWELQNVLLVSFGVDGSVTKTNQPKLALSSMLAPDMLDALLTNPDRMSSLELFRYVNYLKQNKQQSDRYEIALWKRLFYPMAIWVMMLLALPAAYLQARAGAVGSRVFAGILVGVGFHLLNSLFSHLGILNTWPAPMIAVLPSLIALSVAAVLLFWVQRR